MYREGGKEEEPWGVMVRRESAIRLPEFKSRFPLPPFKTVTLRSDSNTQHLTFPTCQTDIAMVPNSLGCHEDLMKIVHVKHLAEGLVMASAQSMLPISLILSSLHGIFSQKTPNTPGPQPLPMLTIPWPDSLVSPQRAHVSYVINKIPLLTTRRSLAAPQSTPRHQAYVRHKSPGLTFMRVTKVIVPIKKVSR